MPFAGRRFVFFIFSLTLSAGLAAAEPVGQIVSLKGEGTITRSGTTTPLSLMGKVEPLDIISTGKNGIAIIQFKDHSAVTVGTASQLVIDEYVYDENAPADNKSTLRVGAGFFQFVSGKLERKKVQLKTPVSTIGIRGTELAGEVQEDGKTLVSLVECCVDIRNESGTSTLERIGTYSEVSSRRGAPTSPALTPDWWADKAVAALGTSRESLGLPELDIEQTPKDNHNYESGPNTRKSFPFFKDSLIK